MSVGDDKNVAYTSLDNMNIETFIKKKKSDKKWFLDP